uniref:Unannotated protein n=1 Tax=freshwater metagenome TaxID=449393 RepID=A0A6J7MW94_9ZZZZ
MWANSSPAGYSRWYLKRSPGFAGTVRAITTPSAVMMLPRGLSNTCSTWRVFDGFAFSCLVLNICGICSDTNSAR